MLHLIKQDDVMRAIFGSRSTGRHAAPISPAARRWRTTPTPTGSRTGQNIAKAKELFKKAGYDGRPVVVLQATNHYFANPAGLFVAQWLREAGVNVDLAAMRLGRVVTRRAVKKPPAEGGWNIFSPTATGIAFSNPIASPGTPRTATRPGSAGRRTTCRRSCATTGRPRRDARRPQGASPASCRRTPGTTSRTLYLGQFFRGSAWRKNVTGVLGMPEIVPFWNVEKAG